MSQSTSDPQWKPLLDAFVFELTSPNSSAKRKVYLLPDGTSRM